MGNMGLFEKLPAELRNEIYDLALTHRPDGQKASPALLQTCKQIHSEGQQVLCHNSIFYLDAAIDGSGILVAGTVNGYFMGNGMTLSIDAYLKHPNVTKLNIMKSLLPAGAARVRRFRLHVDITAKPKTLSSLLLYLNSFLRADDCEVKELELHIRDCNTHNDVDDPWFYLRALYPIAKLPSNIDLKLTLEGFDLVIEEALMLFRYDDRPDTVDSLSFDICKELQDLETSVMAMSLQANPRTDCLRAAGKQLWAILTREVNVKQKLYKRETYSWDIEQVFRKNIDLLKMIIEKLREDPDKDEQYNFLIGCKALVNMSLTPSQLVRHLEGGRGLLSAFQLGDYPWFTASEKELDAASAR